MQLRHRVRIFSTLLLFFFSLSEQLVSQPARLEILEPGSEDNPHQVPEVTSSFKIDGQLDEPAWESALSMEFPYEVQPGENTPAPVRTTVLLASDENNFYAAFRCYDPDPSAIVSHLRDHDEMGNDDWVAIILDTFNDERRAFDFGVTAGGVQLDAVETPNDSDMGWDAIWTAKTRITDWGYAVEIKIPFSSLRFQRSDGEQIWGFDAVRDYPRDRRYRLGLHPWDRSNNCLLCQSPKIVGFASASPGRNIEINPTGTAFRSDTRTDMPSGNMEKDTQKGEVGLTARWGFTPNLTLSLTANPDFSQVEADALQLDINQPFALFYPERRPFFTEGGDIFLALKQVIHTRTMRNPTWGAKVNGKEGANTIGAYVVRDNVTNLVFPGADGSSSESLEMANTSSAIRYKRDFGSRYTVGLLGTDREGMDYFNRVAGFDLDFRFTPKDQVQLLVLGSDTKYPEDIVMSQSQSSDSFSDRLISFEYDHYTRSLGWWVDYEEAGENFRADLGYVPRVGYRNAEGGLMYTWIAEPGKWWSQFRLGSEANYFDTIQGDLLSRRGALWVSYSGIRQTRAYLEIGGMREGYDGQEFDRLWGIAQGSIRPSGNIEADMFILYGDRIDYANTRLGRRFQMGPSITYNIGDHLHLSASHVFERMTVNDAHLYTANIVQLTAKYQFNIRTFIRTTLQYIDYRYNTANYTFDQKPEYRRLYSEALFNYRINPRTVLFLGYSDAYHGNDEYDLTQSKRRFFTKVGYAWVL